MEEKEVKLYEVIGEYAGKYNHAVAAKSSVAQAKDRLCNVLINNLDQIVDDLELAAKAKEEIAQLNVELESADDELAELDKEIKALRAMLPEGTAVDGKYAIGVDAAKAEDVTAEQVVNVNGVANSGDTAGVDGLVEASPDEAEGYVVGADPNGSGKTGKKKSK